MPANTARVPPITTTVSGGGDDEVADHAPPIEPQQAADRARAEQGDRHGVHRGDQRADPGVDDGGREKELKRVGRNAEEIEEERHGGVEAAEERQQPGQGQPRIVRHGTATSANQPRRG
jgi:hypothetical protein